MRPPARRFLAFPLVLASSCLALACWPDEDGHELASNGATDEDPWWEQNPAGDATSADAGVTREPEDVPAPATDDDDTGATPAPNADVTLAEPEEPEEPKEQPSNDGGTGSTSLLLDQTGNPIYRHLVSYAAWRSTSGSADEQLAADVALADNLLTWQMPHGGFFKNGLERYTTPWDGRAARSDWTGAGGVELGTIDNDATVNELLFLADVYQRTGAESYRDGARRALEFLLTMQLERGGFPQVHPQRTGTTYSNYVTFNDDAMARVLVLLLQISNEVPPLDGDVFTAEQRESARAAIEVAVDYILKAQIEQDGKKTVWCAQHDPNSYEPRGGRSYELPSKSGKESIGVVTFLMTQPQTPEVESAVKAAIAWYESDAVQLKDTEYVSRASNDTDDSYNPIRSKVGSTMWCRFYELEQDVCFFSGRLPTDSPAGVGKQYDIMDIEPERRYGYQWGGAYGTPLLEYARRVGY